MLRKRNLAILAFVAGLCSYAIWGSFNDTKLPPPQPVAEEHRGTAIFAGGCFWCMEPPFDKLPGVVAVESGYTGGWKENPTYEEVSHTETGHVEAVRVTYDRRRLAYEDLLQVFWRNVDPTDDGGQFVDRGKSYLSVIFVANEGQRLAAEASKQELSESGRFDKPIVTPIRTATKFYLAEDYHQDYYQKNPLRYKYYRYGSGRDRFLDAAWGKDRDYVPSPGNSDAAKKETGAPER